MKICTKCGLVKPEEEFVKNRCQCKACWGEWQKQYRKENKDLICKKRKQYYAINKEAILEKGKLYRKNIKDTIKKRNNLRYIRNRAERLEWQKKYYNAHRGNILQYNKQYRQNKKESIRAQKRQYENLRRNIDPMLRLNNGISGGIYKSLNGAKKGLHWEELVGYSLMDLKQHLESQFKIGMSWENYGKWHIDHIRPKSSFSFISSDDLEFGRCWSLDNLQPLWAHENLTKGSKWERKEN